MTEKTTMLASDNASGVHPAVMQWLNRVNEGHAVGYGGDRWTHEANERFKQIFGPDVDVYMVTTGTATNVLCLQALAQSVDAVFCSDKAHLLVDECGAVEHSVGCQLVGIGGADGKIDLQALEQAVVFHTGLVHRTRPRVLSFSQATEYGTVYSIAEIKALVGFARDHGLKVHMDGSRLANAACALNMSLPALTRDLGIDLLSFGGTKNGLMMAEAIVNFDPSIKEALPFIRKQGMQLISKQRFLAAQYLAYFENDLWQHNARQANRMAAYLAKKLSAFPQVQIAAPPEINMVFARIPASWIQPLQQVLYFNVWNPKTSEVRFVTSFDTTEQDLDRFIATMSQLAQKGASS